MADVSSIYIREQDGLLTLSNPDDILADEVKVDRETKVYWETTFREFGRIQRAMAEALDA